MTGAPTGHRPVSAGLGWRGPQPRMWFQALTGFREHEVDDVAAQFVIDGEHITSTANGRTMRVGNFETPTLGDLRLRSAEDEAAHTSL